MNKKNHSRKCYSSSCDEYTQYSITDGWDVEFGCGNGFMQQTWIICPDGNCSYYQMKDGKISQIIGTFDRLQYENYKSQMTNLQTDWIQEIKFDRKVIDGVII